MYEKLRQNKNTYGILFSLCEAVDSIRELFSCSSPNISQLTSLIRQVEDQLKEEDFFDQLSAFERENFSECLELLNNTAAILQQALYGLGIRGEATARLLYFIKKDTVACTLDYIENLNQGDPRRITFLTNLQNDEQELRDILHGEAFGFEIKTEEDLKLACDTGFTLIDLNRVRLKCGQLGEKTAEQIRAEVNNLAAENTHLILLMSDRIKCQYHAGMQDVLQHFTEEYNAFRSAHSSPVVEMRPSDESERAADEADEMAPPSYVEATPSDHPVIPVAPRGNEAQERHPTEALPPVRQPANILKRRAPEAAAPQGAGSAAGAESAAGAVAAIPAGSSTGALDARATVPSPTGESSDATETSGPTAKRAREAVAEQRPEPIVLPPQANGAAAGSPLFPSPVNIMDPCLEQASTHMFHDAGLARFYNAIKSCLHALETTEEKNKLLCDTFFDITLAAYNASKKHTVVNFPNLQDIWIMAYHGALLEQTDKKRWISLLAAIYQRNSAQFTRLTLDDNCGNKLVRTLQSTPLTSSAEPNRQILKEVIAKELPKVTPPSNNSVAMVSYTHYLTELDNTLSNEAYLSSEQKAIYALSQQIHSARQQYTEIDSEVSKSRQDADEQSSIISSRQSEMMEADPVSREMMRSSCLSTIDLAEQKLSSLNSKICDLSGRLSQIEKQISELSAQLNHIEPALNMQKSQFAVAGEVKKFLLETAIPSHQQHYARLKQQQIAQIFQDVSAPTEQQAQAAGAAGAAGAASSCGLFARSSLVAPSTSNAFFAHRS
jgi:predicted  nucleic acid-binding Zn-ribbon protein